MSHAGKGIITMKITKKGFTSLLLFFLLFVNTATCTYFSKPYVLSSYDVFKKWIKKQPVLKDVDFSDLKNRLDDEYILYVSKQMPQSILPQLAFLDIPDPNESISDEEYQSRLQNSLIILQNMYDSIENNITDFIDLLEKNNFGSEKINQMENNCTYEEIIEKYNGFVETILHNNNITIFKNSLNALGNRFVEYCFYPETHDHFKKLIEKPENYPIARMIYETMWKYLARNQWISWHESTLNELKKKHDQGYEIVYIAGGSDIYQLIKKGIYNIRNIDPIFPTQTKYYSEGWSYLAKGERRGGGIGDKIIISKNINQIIITDVILTRTFYKEKGYNKLIIKNGEKVKTPKSVTIWTIENKSGEILGRYTLERRFVKQEDFKQEEKKVLLMSLNELFYVLTSGQDNWGIDPYKFGKDTEIYIKQLRSPLSYKVLMNMKAIQESHFPNRFGSSVD